MTRLIPLAVFLIAIAVWSLWPSSGFIEQDIESAKAEIRSTFEKRGLKVKDVVLLKETATKLTGYAKLDVDGTDVTKTCTATMDADRKNYIWTCT